jgi:hypothetical protein
MADSLQKLLQPIDTTSGSFPAQSRYHDIEITTLKAGDGRTIAYLRRRFVPAPENLVTLQEHRVVEGDRLDLLAFRYLGDPELFWRIADANRALQPEELTEVVGKTLTIALPEGIPG